ncbi:hypothetical protein OG21DRAFT_1491106 [Imleria badia]|nr:hypothetical protein OG21DRAFT_1491106 [Imleria badia]
MAQIFSSIFISYIILDQKWYQRRICAFIGWVVVFAMVFVMHIWAYFYQRAYTRQSVLPATNIDIYSSDYPAHVWLMIFYGFLNSMWQTYAYWPMGTMSNNLTKFAVFTGFYE